jgi:polysaccharide export outer membrane protein
MKGVFTHIIHSSWLVVIAVVFLTACSSTSPDGMPLDQNSSIGNYDYLIGPGDELGVFVWRHPEVSQEVTVRPDGRITTPLVEDLNATGKSSSQLARDIEKVLETYIRQPIVTVTVKKFIGPYYQQVRVVGEATTPQALPYSRGMSLLDVMIAVGGLTEFAAGNKASIVRFVENEQKIVPVRIEDLLQDGDISANVPVLPGDVLVIPESWL